MPPAANMLTLLYRENYREVGKLVSELERKPISSKIFYMLSGPHPRTTCTGTEYNQPNIYLCLPLLPPT